MSEGPKTELRGWGRYPMSHAYLARPENVADIRFNGRSIARGLGRAYGDAALNDDGQVILTERLDRVLAFDATTGVVTVEAGLSIGELLALSVPRGWFVPVVPGTQFVSIGGAIAADIHGKNHHVHGSFANHVRSLRLRLADESEIDVGPTANPELFWATAGGMGLTGVIVQATLALRAVETDQIVTHTEVTKDLDATLGALLDDSHPEEYRVVWLDALARGRRFGRGSVWRGTHATRADVAAGKAGRSPLLSATVPMVPPISPLRDFSIGAFNAARFYAQSLRAGQTLQHFSPFFFPLDALSDWNRLYGPRGFLQYQVTVPLDTESVTHVLETLQAHQVPPYLVVLKDFGEANAGLLSFPHRAFTLALDIPVSDRLFEVLDRLDAWVADRGGRVYFAKDARLDAALVPRMYPRLDEFKAIKAKVDPTGRFTSDLARRLHLV